MLLVLNTALVHINRRQYYRFKIIRRKRNREETQKNEKKGNRLEQEDDAPTGAMQVLINYASAHKSKLFSCTKIMHQPKTCGRPA